jgi:geranyl-CoA carboxylase alpha subunit
MAFSKILIANRGEIAVRIMRTARDMGYRTVAVYSDADRDAPHVLAADEAVRIGPPPVSESYLSTQALLDAARHSAAEAIHPGYGFFSENADFAQACINAGLTFIGPSPKAIALMGNKSLARARVIAAGVPCAPGYEGDEQDVNFLLTEARRIGFPVMIKAAAGGGGRGMRRVDAPEDFASLLAQAQAEAQGAFGNGHVLLEKALIDVRHVEVQIFGDSQGNVIHLGERDCSVQRRNQKVVEEAPSPAVDAVLRARMGAAAVAAAQSVDYVGAGTVEFLLAADGSFYFMEMNTRLQVEHPVTELVTGLDLVAWQLRVAAGEPLPLRQEQVVLHGHAIEVRLYAEDPANDYRPQTGRIVKWEPASGAGVRIDSGIREGQEISPYYDAMLAKLIACGGTRDEARRRLLRALQDTHILGLTTNRRFLADILQDELFASGGATTSFLNDRIISQPPVAPILRSGMALAAALLSVQSSSNRQGWRSSGNLSWPMRLQYGENEPQAVTVSQEGQCFEIHHDGINTRVELLDLASGTQGHLRYMTDGIQRTGVFAWLDDGALALDIQDHSMVYRRLSFSERTQENTGNALLVAPMSGKVVAVQVAPGETVTKGQVLVTLEAMKMYHQLTATRDGRVEQVYVAVHQQVDIAARLVALEADPAPLAEKSMADE